MPGHYLENCKPFRDVRRLPRKIYGTRAVMADWTAQGPSFGTVELQYVTDFKMQVSVSPGPTWIPNVENLSGTFQNLPKHLSGTSRGVFQDSARNLSDTFREPAMSPKRSRSNMITNWTCREGDPHKLCYIPHKIQSNNIPQSKVATKREPSGCTSV